MDATGSALSSDSVFTARALTKTYGEGDTAVHALSLIHI